MKRVAMMSWVAAACLAGCKDKGKAAGGGGGEEAGKALPTEIAAWMPEGASQAWQGAWSSRLTLYKPGGGMTSMAGDPAAIEIKGNKATVFDGTAEHALGFSIASPCTAEFTQTITEGSMKGGTSTYTKDYLFANGKLLVGDGSVGYRKGKAAVACTTDGVHTLDDKGTCLVWKERFGKWGSEPATCAWSTADGKELLTIGTGDWAAKLVADGDLLQSDQFQQFVKEGYHTRAKDFAEAKATVTAMVKAKDPVEIAKGEGGKVGETSTVASLNATYGSDPKALEGKEVELTALYVNSNTSSSSDGSKSYAVVLQDSEQSKLSLYCETAEEVAGLAQWDKVIAKGKVEPSFGKAGLADCTLTKAP